MKRSKRWTQVFVLYIQHMEMEIICSHIKIYSKATPQDAGISIISPQ